MRSSVRSFGPACLVLFGLFCGCGEAPEPAEFVLLGGKLVTMDSARPQVSGLAASGGRIVALGDDSEIRRHIGEATQVIELEGRTAVPGFIEGHAHFVGIGRALMNLDVGSLRSWDEVVEKIAAAAEQSGPERWIVGYGWHQEKWDRPPARTVEGYPTHELLSRAVPDRPVLLKHAAGGHGGIVNQAMLDRLNIDDDTPNPPGGTIVRDASGAATGVLREKAYALALAAHATYEDEVSPDAVQARERREIQLADQECLSKGITSLQDAGSTFHTIDLLREAVEQEQIGVRLYVMILEESDALALQLADYRMQDIGDHHLTVRSLKRSIDGALGTHGAWLLEPYSDLPETAGINTVSLDEMRRTIELAMEHDFQLAVHAIGDRANRETLDLFSEAMSDAKTFAARRWRVEHAQHLHPDEIPRFAELGVVASMQGVHCTSDGPWVPTRIGDERSEAGAYVWRKLLDSGAVVSNGTDAPIEDVDPIVNFHSTVTRLMRNGEVFYPDQRMTREEALRAATLSAAYAAFEESEKGSLELGKLADVTVLSRDIMSIPLEQILDTHVTHTIVGGQLKYER